MEYEIDTEREAFGELIPADPSPQFDTQMKPTLKSAGMGSKPRSQTAELIPESEELA
ncbi:hypothetical protein ACOYW6_04120 [Parablastomonas sp. CN1-191]|uniref:hypothetical protein n=1 Tax=Parablastomonas sp. CN1-191 TaxID=3400908 RepID=UPI003BF78E97